MNFIRLRRAHSNLQKASGRREHELVSAPSCSLCGRRLLRHACRGHVQVSPARQGTRSVRRLGAEACAASNRSSQQLHSDPDTVQTSTCSSVHSSLERCGQNMYCPDGLTCHSAACLAFRGSVCAAKCTAVRGLARASKCACRHTHEQRKLGTQRLSHEGTASRKSAWRQPDQPRALALRDCVSSTRMARARAR
jgi:hypothetical protein